MIFSPLQDRAIFAVDKWVNDPSSPQVFYLGGFAGTGKTTLAITLAQNILGRVFFATFTGKAAHVMRTKGCPDATTIHQLIYNPSTRDPKPLQELKFALTQVDPADVTMRMGIEEEISQEKAKLRCPAFSLNPDSELRFGKLLIIDECSMVDQRIGQDLLSFGKKILVLGDPAQLPPIRGEGFFTSNPPDLMLTEIHRQAADSPIIRMATAVREGRGLDAGDHGSGCLVGTKADLFCKTMARDMDQCIVGKNATRRNYNVSYRNNILGFAQPLPVAGDRVVCLRNNHEMGILNGQLWDVEEVRSPMVDTIEMMMLSDDGSLRCQGVVHTGHFLGLEVPWWAKKDAEEFDYGYALTCHKSQGSQWPSVLVFDESQCFREHAQRWLYTAITRASERVVVLR